MILIIQGNKKNEPARINVHVERRPNNSINYGRTTETVNGSRLQNKNYTTGNKTDMLPENIA